MRMEAGTGVDPQGRVETADRDLAGERDIAATAAVVDPELLAK